MNLESIRLEGFTEGEYIGFWFVEDDCEITFRSLEEETEFVIEGCKGEFGC